MPLYVISVFIKGALGIHLEPGAFEPLYFLGPLIALTIPLQFLECAFSGKLILRP